MQEMIDITISCIIFYIFDKCNYILGQPKLERTVW
jgi:hypothetical protein